MTIKLTKKTAAKTAIKNCALSLGFTLLLCGCDSLFDPPEEEAEGGKSGCDALTNFTATCTNTATNIELTLIASGSFAMGSPDSDLAALSGEKPQHSVTISKPFYIGFYEVTRQQWSAVMGGTGGNAPITGVSWDAIANTRNGFIAKLNAEAGAITIGGTRYEYALPSEAQWEYAARGGSVALYSWGDGAAGEFAWFAQNAVGAAHAHGGKKPNGFMLYDTSGNAAEWVQDCWHDYAGEAVSDPLLDCSGSADKIVRGGSYLSKLEDLRSAFRAHAPRTKVDSAIGFRLALVPKRD